MYDKHSEIQRVVLMRLKITPRDYIVGGLGFGPNFCCALKMAQMSPPNRFTIRLVFVEYIQDQRFIVAILAPYLVCCFFEYP
jgi:hypothetical protein